MTRATRGRLVQSAFTAIAATIALAGCGQTQYSGVISESVPPEKLSSLPYWARDGVPCHIFYMSGKLVSGLPAFASTPEDAKNCGYINAIARLSYIPEPMPAGNKVVPFVNVAVYESGGRTPVDAGRFWYGPLGWLEGLQIQGLTKQALEQSRAASQNLKITKAALGSVECEVLTDVVVSDRAYLMVELYVGGRRGVGSGPDRVLAAFYWNDATKGWVKQISGKLIFEMGSKLYEMTTLELASDNSVSQITMNQWEPKFDDIVGGRLDFLTNFMGRVQAIRYVNDFLLEWKTRDMRAVLAAASIPELETMVVKLEKSILEYDLASKKEKDSAQLAVQQEGDASQYLEVSRLLEQRMDIMTSILDTTKQVLTVRRKTQR